MKMNDVELVGALNHLIDLDQVRTERILAARVRPQ